MNNYNNKSSDKMGGGSYFLRILQSIHNFEKIDEKNQFKKSPFLFFDIDGMICDVYKKKFTIHYLVELIDLKDETPLESYSLNRVKEYKDLQIGFLNELGKPYIMILTKYNGKKSDITNLQQLDENPSPEQLDALWKNVDDLQNKYTFKVYTKELINLQDSTFNFEGERIWSGLELDAFFRQKSEGYNKLAEEQIKIKLQKEITIKE